MAQFPVRERPSPASFWAPPSRQAAAPGQFPGAAEVPALAGLRSGHRTGNVTGPTAAPVTRSATVAQPADPMFRPYVGLHLILIEHGKVLLLQRANTGFADGSWSLPGGCLDEGEPLPAGAAREAREELGIVIDPADLAFAHLCHHADPDGQARIGVFFTTTRWTGHPANTEPGKCAKIDWFDPDSLPGDTVTYIRDGLTAHRDGKKFSLNGWPPIGRPEDPL